MRSTIFVFTQILYLLTHAYFSDFPDFPHLRSDPEVFTEGFLKGLLDDGGPY